MKKLFLLISLIIVSYPVAFADNCTESVSVTGIDSAPVTATISSFPCTNGGPVTAITMDASIGDFCPDWYTYNIIVNGITIANGQCDQTGFDLSSYLPITSVSLQSVDMDDYSDAITLSLTLNITYTFLGCSGTPDPGNTVSSDNPACPGVNFTLSLQNPTPGGDVIYQWQSSPTGGDPWTNEGISEAIYTTFQSVETYYRCQVTCSGNTGISNPLLVTMNTLNNCYCLAGSDLCDEYIGRVQVGTIDNISDCSTNGYADYTLVSSDIQKGLSLEFTVTNPVEYSEDQCGVWVDWNKDGDFNDEGEFFTSTNVGGTGASFTGTVTPPMSSVEESTRLRVRLMYTGILDPCGNANYGEVEDYTVNVLPAPPCLPPTNPATLNISPTSANLSFDVPAIEPESFFDVFFGLEGFDPATGGTMVSGIPGPPYTLEGLVVNTSYDWYARSNCMAFSEPKIDYYWLGLNENHQPVEPSGGIANEAGETGAWEFYTAPNGDTWYNVWFYNDPYDPARMKIIRMGFWVKPLSPLFPTGTISYVVNWSTQGWVTPDPPEPGYPQPDDEAFIARSPENGPFVVYPAVPEVNPFGQWMELFFIIPDYNPEWVSVDIWGDNIVILQQPVPPPSNSMLAGWFQQNPGSGGMIVHECVPKPTGNVSPWIGPITFTTACYPFDLPVCESFFDVTMPDCWTEQLEGLIVTPHWLINNSDYAGGSPYEAVADFDPSEGLTQADNDRLVSPPLNTTGLSSVHLSFRHMLEDWTGGDVWIKVQSSADGMTWTDEWVHPAGVGINIPAELFQLDITNNLGGTTWIAWTLSGYTYNINNWFVDDICISQSQCLVNTWTGAISTEWGNPANWSCQMVPNESMSILIEAGLGQYPLIGPGIIANCFELNLESGADITVATGGVLNIANP